MKLEPCLDIAKAFVTALLGIPDAPIRLCRMPDGPNKFAGDLEGPIAAIWPHVVEAQNAGLGIFYYVNKVKEGPGSGKGGCAKIADVEQARALYIDDPKGGVPEGWEWHVEPDLLVYTSKTEREGRLIQKCQALWRLPATGNTVPAWVALGLAGAGVGAVAARRRARVRSG